MADQIFSIDRSHSRLGFAGKHLMVSTVRGSFAEYEATVTAPEGDTGQAVVNATVKTASLTTGSEDRDNHLRSADFFDAEKYPEMTFVSTSVVKKGDDRYTVTGDLTIKDITKPVTLDVSVDGKVNDPWGNERVGLTVKGRINRKDWGLNWNMAIEAGGVMVSENIDLDIEAAAVRKLEVEAAAATA